ncbi:hypothetical protein GFY24_30745 [Nocardia sp. SYP-A9097]|uniref:pentapeptide repeat-containing protein n=1 Tax=Nocardia sp. SYP-A9097 TaxID=2663237 RepID=UPI00129BDDF8|nr:pentapeptide repeat-containing protein [Nocardia sp. SYP-A9097]MRH91767.1 hypothetical protein [Nocardia sp. SYP-A9097]
MILTQPVATVTTGVLAVIVALIALTGVLLTRRQSGKHFVQTHKLDRDRALRERYTTCAEQLAHDKPAIRQAGVYALAALADDWHNDPSSSDGRSIDTQVCMDLLCAYLRGPVLDDADGAIPRDLEVRRAIFEVFRRHRDQWRGYAFDLGKVNFSDMDLGKIILVWSTNLSDSILARAVLSGSKLGGSSLIRADLSGADLTDADLTSANLTGADLTGADLTGAVLTNANLTGATLSGAKLTDAVLSDTILKNAVLSAADLSGAYLVGSDLTGAKLIDAKLNDANLVHTRLSYSDLTGADLIDADLTGAKVDYAKLNWATAPLHLP